MHEQVVCIWRRYWKKTQAEQVGGTVSWPCTPMFIRASVMDGGSGMYDYRHVVLVGTALLIALNLTHDSGAMGIVIRHVRRTEQRGEQANSEQYGCAAA